MSNFNIYGNPTEEMDLVFDSSDLFECLDFAKQNDDFSHLETAISLNHKNKREAKILIKELLDAHSHTDNDYLKNKLTKIKNLLR